jgi:ribosomal protein S6--L-glutamate ligase
MKFILLSQNPRLYSTNRMVEAAERLGHEIELVDFRRCCASLEPERPRVLLGDHELSSIDAVIGRIGASSSIYGTAIVRQFEMQDILCVNGSQAIARSRDKLRSLQILTRKGIGIPRTAAAAHPDDVDRLLKAVGEPPYVIKLVEGTQGLGVIKVDTFLAARSVVEAFHGLSANIIVQEFIAEAAGTDLRCFVVGEKVIAAMRRQGAPGEFRSNLHRGGHASAAELSSVERKTAVAAAKAMGLRVAGVDMLQSNRGPLIMEVNSSPGLEGIEQATGIDVAGKIVRYIEKHAPMGHRGDRATAH